VVVTSTLHFLQIIFIFFEVENEIVRIAHYFKLKI
jgi:hypothetical protein